MNKECIYVADTPYGRCCTIGNKPCFNPFVNKCDEPEWQYLMQLAKDYEEDDAEII